jgi:hypothetical protein
MLIDVTDYNRAGAIFAGSHFNEWNEVDASLAAAPLHLKYSGEKGKASKPVWDPVGNNWAIHAELTASTRGWRPKIPIPLAYRFFGKDVDFMQSGVIVEVQFSNYPFLLNNLVRADFFFKQGIELDGAAVEAIIIITKVKMFDASQSSLYYERAVEQLDALAAANSFSVPVRLVGLHEPHGPGIPVVFMTYPGARTRGFSAKRATTAHIQAGTRVGSRSVIVVK